MTGMELIQLIRGEKATPPSGIATLGLDRSHRWLTVVEPGHVELEWEVDETHFNLEGAVICSWTAALGDQALFFATNTLCADGEGTRMASFSLCCLRNIKSGVIRVEARVVERLDDVMLATADFHLPDGGLAARMTATVIVTR